MQLSSKSIRRCLTASPATEGGIIINIEEIIDQNKLQALLGVVNGVD